MSEDDIERMAQACENSCDRTFLLCVDETVRKIAEVLNLAQWMDDNLLK